MFSFYENFLSQCIRLAYFQIKSVSSRVTVRAQGLRLKSFLPQAASRVRWFSYSLRDYGCLSKLSDCFGLLDGFHTSEFPSDLTQEADDERVGKEENDLADEQALEHVTVISESVSIFVEGEFTISTGFTIVRVADDTRQEHGNKIQNNSEDATGTSTASEGTNKLGQGEQNQENELDEVGDGIQGVDLRPAGITSFECK